MYQHFVNRQNELQFLEERYASKQSEFIVIYGRRRIGKTELVLKSLENKKGIYFLASKEGDRENIKDFSREAGRFINDRSFAEAEFRDWFTLFKSLIDNVKFNKILEKKKAAIVIDEFPFLIHGNNAIPSIFQRIWELLLKRKNIMLILLGSYVSVMESRVLSNKSPLYGRRTGGWLLEPLKFKHLNQFLPEYQAEDLMKSWFVLGGTPVYLLKFNPEMPFFENIKNNMIRKGTYLYQEVDFLLNEEFREPKNYKLILKAISFGKTTMREICNYAGLDKSMVSKYIDVLEKMHLVYEEMPVTASPKFKRRHYVIKDPYFNFWFRFIYPNRIDIEAMRYDEVLRTIRNEFNQYSGTMFERLILELMIKKDVLRDVPFTKIGRWWHKDKEIDIVAINEQKKEILFTECKWKSGINAEKIVRELAGKTEFVQWNNHKTSDKSSVSSFSTDVENEKRKESYAVFAKSFSKKINESEGKKVFCFDLKDLEKILSLS